jgi:hypothetical protein
MKVNYSVFIGKKFGKLKIVSFFSSKSGMKATCVCDCGSAASPLWTNVRRKRTRSCGCLEKESRFSHGKSSSPAYVSWENMINRCDKGSKQQQNSPLYSSVDVCPQWKSFEGFYKDMGDRPHGTSLDRIDNSKGYFKENCRWATRQEQQQNLRTNVWLEFNGEKKVLSEWSRVKGIPLTTLLYRLKRGWPLDKALRSRF